MQFFYKVSKINNEGIVFANFRKDKWDIIEFLEDNLNLNFSVDSFFMFDSLKDIEFYKKIRLIKYKILKEINEKNRSN